MNRPEHYIVRLSLRPRQIVGPYSWPEAYAELVAGLLSWTDIAWCPSRAGDWTRLYDVPELRGLVDALPDEERLHKYREMCMRSGEEPSRKEPAHDEARFPAPPEGAIYLQSHGREFGPLGVGEIEALYRQGEIREPVYAWYAGLKTLLPWSEVPVLREFSSGGTSVGGPRARDDYQSLIYRREARSSSRHPLPSRIALLAPDGSAEDAGTCVDVSASGMLVWLDQDLGWRADQEHDLEISPLSVTGLDRFRVRVSVAWYKSTRAMGGVRFLGMGDSARSRLRAYLEAQESRRSREYL